jgi:hypothetical protein
MGKFTNSDIHNKYSDWHWSLREIDDKYKRLYVSDVDRLWIEYDFRNDFVWLIDIKYEGSGDVLTPTEEKVRDWFIKHDAQFYTVYISRDFTTFRVINSNNLEKTMQSIEYADWLLSLRSGISSNGFRPHKEVLDMDNQTISGDPLNFQLSLTDKLDYEIPI